MTLMFNGLLMTEMRDESTYETVTVRREFKPKLGRGQRRNRRPLTHRARTNKWLADEFEQVMQLMGETDE